MSAIFGRKIPCFGVVAGSETEVAACPEQLLCKGGATPKAVVLDADAARWTPVPGGLYAAGIHPWWTQDADFSLAAYLRGLERLLEYPEVVQLGECGLDRLRGAAMAEQLSVFRAQAELSERLAVPMTPSMAAASSKSGFWRRAATFFARTNALRFARTR